MTRQVPSVGSKVLQEEAGPAPLHGNSHFYGLE